MKKNLNEALEEVILYRVKLFSKENYFRYFRYILLELSNNIYAFREKKTLSNSLSSKLIEGNNLSIWMLIYKLMFQIKNEITTENEMNLNPLCFQYLKTLCLKRMKKLVAISNAEVLPLDQVIFVYLNLCEKQIKINKDKGNYFKYKTEYRSKDRKSIIAFNQENNLLNNNQQMKINHRKLGAKNGPISKPLSYNNSYTRLFIGETDKESIRERYLSNMAVKKQKQLHLSNAYGDFSIIYLKNMYKKLFEKKVKLKCDNDMIKIVKQFENDYKVIDNFQRSEFINSNNNSKIKLKYNKHKGIHIKKNNNLFLRNKSGISHRLSIGPSEISKNNSQEVLFALSNSRRYKSKSFHNSMTSKKKIKDSLILTAREINSYKSSKMIDFGGSNANATNKKLQRNFSAIMMKPNLNKKRFHLINYMRKKDFFFS